MVPPFLATRGMATSLLFLRFRLELESTSCVKGLLLPDVRVVFSICYKLMMKSSMGQVYSIPLKDTAHMGNSSIFVYKSRTEIEAADKQRRECSNVGVRIGAII
ncbi:uncharacterized protein LOC127744720 [Arachis duranensis]|uniref:Uncharacterized protein LOC127744720 n=1 Tax=Arachis duranensis TaxID=130453 RepID=A0A9C6WK87_ARADU|nr:uncharacterized protein LOC127744720 [Arachis duranensis]